MEPIKALLKSHFIYKDKDRDLYYEIYDNYNDFRGFLQNKLGFQLLIRNDFTRLEKIPSDTDEFMGIESFNSVEEYIMLMLLLVFLEDKAKDEQFLLTDIVEFIEGNGILPVDITKQKTRRQICHMLNFADEACLLQLCGGNIEKYINDENTQVLYDNTGLSKYFMRRLPVEFNDCMNFEELDELIKSENSDKTTARRNAVYRNLLLKPAVYNKETELDEFEYIKNQRSVISNDFEKYLGWALHVQKDMAMLVPRSNEAVTDYFPSLGGINTAVLLFNLKIREMVEDGEWNPDKRGRIRIKKEEFIHVASILKKEKEQGFIQNLRKMSNECFANELLFEMKKFMMCETENEIIGDSAENSNQQDWIIILPAAAKIVGDFPKTFYRGDSKDE